MRNCLVLGSRRSGSSMVVGALARAGYHLGELQMPPGPSHPHGVFDAQDLDEINDQLLLPHVSLEDRHRYGERWLAIPNGCVQETMSAALEAKAREVLRHAPWCFKDSRFCFTLPAWRPLLENAALVCVFRHPSLNATSMVEEANRSIDLDHAFELWTATYRQVLERHANGGDWLFLHYDQLLKDEGRARLGKFIGTDVDPSFPDPKMRRDLPKVEAPAEALELYDKLCRRASYAPVDQCANPTQAVAVVAIVSDGDEPLVDGMIANARGQRGVRTNLILVDATTERSIIARASELVGATVVPSTSISRGQMLRDALAGRTEPYVATALPGCHSLPSRLAHAIEALEADADIVTCDYLLADHSDHFIDRSSPEAMGEAPGPFWEAGLVARRETFASLSRTAFFPNELELLRRMRAAGRAAHVTKPGFFVRLDDYNREFDRSVDDAALVTLNGRTPDLERPQLTVCVSSNGDRNALLACLESFSRQLLPRGTFEVIVVHSDAEGTPSRALNMKLADVEFPVPTCLIHRPDRGRAASQNKALALARGELVLLATTDTIAAPDLVETHVRAHRRLFGTSVVVMGRHVRSGGRRTALARQQICTELQADASLDAFCFATGNASVPLDAVARAGGVDESFDVGSDVDLAVRLQSLGYRFVFEPRATSMHSSTLDLQTLRREAIDAARGQIRLGRKFPELVPKISAGEIALASCLTQLDETADERRILEDAIEELGRIDVWALEAMKDDYAEVAREVQAHVASLMPRLEEAWRVEGHAIGLRENQLDSLDNVLATGTDRWPISSEATRRLLAWPDWTDPTSLSELMGRVKPMVSQHFAALVLCYDARVDGPRDQALDGLREAFASELAEGDELEVVLEESPLGADELHRLGRSVDAVLPLGCEPQGFLDLVVAEPLPTADAVAAWLDRSREIETENTFVAPSLPELTVIIPTFERPDTVQRLLERLSAQDLEPTRFEVLVVDDGSKQQLSNEVDPRHFAFPLQLLSQWQSGPAKARNLALGRARGTIVLFLNDDAVPDPDVLRKHLESHARCDSPRAVLGSFALLPEHRRHSVGEYVETSTNLFAEPAMRRGVLYPGLSFHTGNISVRRSALDAIGGFDESFPYAGGEDSELGLRLEREHGIRVLFDPSIVCYHDHAVSAESLVERKHVIGWAAHVIQTKHGDLDLLPVPSWPPNESAWNQLENAIVERSPECSKIVQAVSALSDKELADGSGPVAVENVRQPLGVACELAVLYGALLAERGQRPDGTHSTTEIELPNVAPAASNVTSSRA